MSEKNKKSGFMETLKKIMAVIQLISLLMAVISSAVFILYPESVTGVFFDFIGMPQMMSEEEILENPDEKIEKCGSSMMGPDLCYMMMSGKIVNRLPDKAMYACDQISDNDTRDNCYREIAFKIYGKDVSKAREACRQIRDDITGGNCYSGIARNLIDVNPGEAIKSCRSISNNYTRDDCCRE
ncbi:MAG: hypothetical protein KAU03_01700, partial [Candidatus Altiarchaeales archaeon]|nr:hypothetical protein [Candidatus Altiarchaeales archaeon]